MSHSLAANLGMWDPTVPALTSRFRVLRYETRGHGKTDARPSYPREGRRRAGARARPLGGGRKDDHGNKHERDQAQPVQIDGAPRRRQGTGERWP